MEVFHAALEESPRRRRGVRDGHELAIAPDPDVAVPVCERGVEERYVGADRRQRDNAVTGLERIVDHAPVAPVREHVGADQSADRDERQTFLRGLERAVYRRAGRVEHLDRSFADRSGEAWRRPVLPEGYR